MPAPEYIPPALVADFAAWESRHRSDDTEPAARLFPAVITSDKSPEELAAIEQRREAASAALRAEQNKARFDAICPLDLNPAFTDWAHPGLAPYQAPIAAVRAWQFGSIKGVLASGDSYRGKSRAMWALMHRLQVEEGRRISYFAAADFFARLNEQVNYGRDEARGWIDGIAALPLLFIDDVGQEAMIIARERWARAWFFRMLDLRRSARLPLFITTNLSAKEMAQDPSGWRADPALSRLLDLCEPVRFVASA